MLKCIKYNEQACFACNLILVFIKARARYALFIISLHSSIYYSDVTIAMVNFELGIVKLHDACEFMNLSRVISIYLS